MAKRLKNKVVDITCPKCKGAGHIRIAMWPNGREKYTQKHRVQAFRLFKAGKTMREIAREIGVGHPQTVKNLVAQYIARNL